MLTTLTLDDVRINIPYRRKEFDLVQLYDLVQLDVEMLVPCYKGCELNGDCLI